MPSHPAKPVLILVMAMVGGAISGLFFSASPFLQAQSTSPLTIQPDTGRVGIGTMTPGTKLDVVGTEVVGIRYLKSGLKDSRITVGDPGKSWSAAVGWATQGDFSVIEEGVAGDRLYIKQGGNVGIGTTAPAYKLDVVGQIRATAGTGIYTPAAGCSGAGSLITTALTCTTGICPIGGTYAWRDCAGACGSPSTATCSNTLLGRLVAP